MERKQLGRALMAMGALLIGLAAIIVLLNRYANHKAAQDALQVTEQLKQQWKVQNTSDVSAEIEEKSFVTPESTADYFSEEELFYLKDDSYIGVLQIPSINKELPVAGEWSYEKLKFSPCRYSGTIQEKNLIIVAHNYPSHFGGINKLLNGDEIRLMTSSNQTYIYAVQEIEVIDGRDLEGMNKGDWDLTLFTCTLSGKSRVTIRCNLMGIENKEFKSIKENLIE